MKQQEVFKEMVSKNDLNDFTNLIKNVRDKYVKPLNIKDKETLKKLNEDYSRLSIDFENDICLYVVKLIDKHKINRNNIEQIIQLIDKAFSVADPDIEEEKALKEMINIYKKYNIDFINEKLNLIEIIDDEIRMDVGNYVDSNKILQRSDGTAIAVMYYTKHFIENISIVAKTAYMITEVGRLDRFNQSWIKDIKKFIKKYEI